MEVHLLPSFHIITTRLVILLKLKRTLVIMNKPRDCSQGIGKLKSLEFYSILLSSTQDYEKTHKFADQDHTKKKRCHQFTWSLVQKSTSKSCILPGGGFNPFEKYVQMKIGILPQIGVINKKHSKPPPSISLHHHINHMPPVFPTTHLSPPSTTHTLGAWPIGQIWVASPLSLVSARTEAAAQLPGWDHRSADGRKYVERV